MDQSSMILYVIIAVVLIGVPAVLAKKTGKSLREMLFGKRSKTGFFGKQKENAREDQPRVRKQTNSNRNDMLDLISKLATLARRNHFRLIVPGTLSCGDTTAVLTALLITRSCLVGINCFGFGGRVIGKPGEEDWEQIMNGEETPVPSPVRKNRLQEETVRRVLEETGRTGTDVEIIGVFTSPSVWLSNVSGTNCYTKENALKYLKSDRFMRDGGLDPAALEEALEPRIVRAKDKKSAQQEEKDA